jgi:hypothetical protein
MDTDQLLKWATDHDCYIEIYADGSAQVQMMRTQTTGSMGEFDSWRFDGNTLSDAINKARRHWCRCARDERYRVAFMAAAWKETDNE